MGAHIFDPDDETSLRFQGSTLSIKEMVEKSE